MAPIAYIVHSIQDRIRFHIPSRKRDAAYFTELEKAFAACNTVLAVETDPLTASILLKHKGDPADLTQYALEHRLFASPPPAVAVNPPIVAVASRLEQLDQTVQRMTQGAFDLNGIAFVGLVGAGLFQVWRGRTLGSATSLLSYAVALLALQRTKRPTS
jgi:hypothetical protein